MCLLLWEDAHPGGHIVWAATLERSGCDVMSSPTLLGVGTNDKGWVNPDMMERQAGLWSGQAGVHISACSFQSPSGVGLIPLFPCNTPGPLQPGWRLAKPPVSNRPTQKGFKWHSGRSHVQSSGLATPHAPHTAWCHTCWQRSCTHLLYATVCLVPAV